MTTTRKTAIVLFGLDVVTTVLVFMAVSFLYLRGLRTDWNYVVVLLAGPVPAVVFAVYLIEGYKARTDMLSLDYASQHAIALLGAMLGTLLVTYVFIPGGYELQSSRFVIATSFLALVPITLGYRRVAYLRIARSQGARSLVFLGDYASCCAFREECEKMGTTQPVVYSVVSDGSVAPFGPRGEGGMLRPFYEVIEEVQSGKIPVEAIVLRESNRELMPEVSQRLVQLYFGGVPTYTLELFHQVYWQKIPLYRLNQTWLFQEGFQIAREPVFERLKRVSDIGFSLFGLLLATPLSSRTAARCFFSRRGSAKTTTPSAS